MKYLSLFSGIGGFELGIQQAYESNHSKVAGLERERGVEGVQRGQPDDPSAYGRQPPTCIGYSEIDKYAVSIYQKHFNHKNYGDITKINPAELPDFDLLVGGFPCQAFSVAGLCRGFDDTRGTLFFDIARILREKQPRLFLLENVKGLLSHDVGRTFKTIISTLTELGYDLQWQVLNSKDFGVPQNRSRIFIVGNLRGTPRPKVFPFRQADQIYNAGSEDEEKMDSVASTLTARQFANWGENFVRENPVAPTLRATDHKRGDNQTTVIEDEWRIRRLTPVECERLQGFPDGWTEGISDTQRYKCLGNAVTVNVIREIAKKLLCD